jgi:Eukaryotic initiation factor 4E
MIRNRSSWVFWFSSQPKKCVGPEYSKVFKQGLIKLCSIDTKTSFFQFKDYLVKGAELKHGCNLYIFLEGVQPLWEENVNGACLSIKLERSFENLNEYWNKLIKACGESNWSDSIVGISISSRYAHVILQIWISNAQDNHLKATQEIKSCLEDPELNVTLKYHDECLQKMVSSILL